MTTDTDEGSRRVCLLTGAGGTLGSAFCRRHAGDYDIVAVSHHTTPLVPSQEASAFDPLAPEAVDPVNEDRVHVVRADLTRADDIDRVIEVALARFGRIDLVVNAVGFARWASLLDRRLLPENLAKHVELNVTVPAAVTVAVTRACWQETVEENRDRHRNVVNVSSTAGVYVYPRLGQAAYGASKAALNFLTMHLAEELLHLGVRANALAPTTFPGRVPTDAVLDGIRCLDASLETGQILVVDEDGRRFL